MFASTFVAHNPSIFMEGLYHFGYFGGASIMILSIRRAHARRTLSAIFSIAFAGLPNIEQKIRLGNNTV